MNPAQRVQGHALTSGRGHPPEHLLHSSTAAASVVILLPPTAIKSAVFGVYALSPPKPNIVHTSGVRDCSADPPRLSDLN